MNTRRGIIENTLHGSSHNLELSPRALPNRVAPKMLFCSCNLEGEPNSLGNYFLCISHLNEHLHNLLSTKAFLLIVHLRLLQSSVNIAQRSAWVRQLSILNRARDVLRSQTEAKASIALGNFALSIARLRIDPPTAFYTANHQTSNKKSR